MNDNNHSRRHFLQFAGLGTLAFSLPNSLRARGRSFRSPGSRLVYIGTYTNGRSEGIYVCRLDLSSGALRRVDVAKGVVNPSFLTIDRQARFLYAVNEVAKFENKPSGAISSFGIDRQNGSLTLLSQKPSAGAGPCHLTVDATNKFLLAANYDVGSVAVLPVRRGRLLPPVEVIQHHGSSLNPSRQQGPHAHGVVLDETNRYLFVPDLGLDKIMIYKFDSRSGKLTPLDEVEIQPGAGPRHFKFHPTGKWGFVINEINSTITAFSFDEHTGTLREVQSVSTLPADFSGKNSCAEIEVAPSGKFVYGSNRGHDSIVVFSVDQRTGKLNLVQHISTGGKTPRNFTLDPAGDFLLVANQNSDNVITFRIDRESGALSPTGHTVEIPAPVCVAISDRL